MYSRSCEPFYGIKRPCAARYCERPCTARYCGASLRSKVLRASLHSKVLPPSRRSVFCMLATSILLPRHSCAPDYNMCPREEKQTQQSLHVLSSPFPSVAFEWGGEGRAVRMQQAMFLLVRKTRQVQHKLFHCGVLS